MPSMSSPLLVPVECIRAKTICGYLHETVMASQEDQSRAAWREIKAQLQQYEDFDVEFRRELASFVSKTSKYPAATAELDTTKVYVNLASDEAAESWLNGDLFQASKTMLRHLRAADLGLDIPPRLEKPSPDVFADFVMHDSGIQILKYKVGEHSSLDTSEAAPLWTAEALLEVLYSYSREEAQALVEHVNQKAEQDCGDPNENGPYREERQTFKTQGRMPDHTTRNWWDSQHMTTDFVPAEGYADSEGFPVRWPRRRPGDSHPLSSRRGRSGQPPIVQQSYRTGTPPPLNPASRPASPRERFEPPREKVWFEYPGSRRPASSRRRAPITKVYVMQASRPNHYSTRRDSSIPPGFKQQTAWCSPESDHRAYVQPSRSYWRSDSGPPRFSRSNQEPQSYRTRPPTSTICSYNDIPHNFFKGCVKALAAKVDYQTKKTWDGSILGPTTKNHMIASLKAQARNQSSNSHQRDQNRMRFVLEDTATPSDTARRIEEAARSLLLADAERTDRTREAGYMTLRMRQMDGAVVAAYMREDPWLKENFSIPAQTRGHAASRAVPLTPPISLFSDSR